MRGLCCPIQCIIPPYMLEKILEKGSKRLVERTQKAYQLSNSFRHRRVAFELHRAHFSGLAQTAPRARRRAAATVEPTPSRKVYDAQSQEDLPGTLVRDEGNPDTGDSAVDEAYNRAGLTWDLFWKEYGRNSIDDQGAAIVQTVHYGDEYNNAFWNGEQMAYGDGDEELFTRFTSDVDIVGHELSHGVIQASAGLVYFYQSGALNESFADVFGSLIKQRNLDQEAQDADWLVGDNVLIGEGYALRSMKAPGTGHLDHPILGDDPQPATMDDYKHFLPFQDFGGVHINSGIPNHAFYLTAMKIGGKAWKKAGLIWYRALTERLGRIAHFSDCANATLEAAREEFGSGSLESQAVQEAWEEVKVL